LERRGIETGVHYPIPCHWQEPYRRFAHETLPVAERAAAEVLSLPVFPHMTEAQICRVCEALHDLFQEEVPAGVG
jgi:dTDP-4-amino-4,6-dideoxygalactose transaminase